MRRYCALVICVSLIVMAVPALLFAQAPPTTGESEKGWTSYASFEGTSNSDGQVMQLNSSVGYNFTKMWGVDGGVPIYFVHNSVNPQGFQTSNNGLGDMFADLRFKLEGHAVNYASTLTGTAPTGDSNKGLSTGRATIDWSNRFDHKFDNFTPFVVAGLGNTSPQQRFFHRPYMTLGFMSHFEGGATYDIGKFVSVGASGYYLLPGGTQKVYSRLFKQNTLGFGSGGHGRFWEVLPFVTGPSDIAKDNGLSTWVDVTPTKIVDLEAGYSRSTQYDLNSFSFGIGFNIGEMFKHVNR
jgi:hypothetical protein